MGRNLFKSRSAIGGKPLTGSLARNTLRDSNSLDSEMSLNDDPRFYILEADREFGAAIFAFACFALPIILFGLCLIVWKLFF